MEQTEKRKVGRPKKSEEEKKTGKISFYVSKSEYELYRHLVQAGKANLLDWLNSHIDESFGDNFNFDKTLFSKKDLGLSNLKIAENPQKSNFFESGEYEITLIKNYPFDDEKVYFIYEDFVLIPILLEADFDLKHPDILFFGENDTHLNDAFLGGILDYAFLVEKEKISDLLKVDNSDNKTKKKLKEVLMQSLSENIEGGSYSFCAENGDKKYFIFSFSSIDRKMNNILSERLKDIVCHTIESKERK